MNHSDIKLVIDQLHGMELTPSTDEVIIFNAVNTLETLGNQVVQQAEEIRLLKQAVQHEADCVDAAGEKIVQQAAEITKLREYFQVIKEYNLHYGLPLAVINLYKEALAISTDSKQFLQEWLDSVLGEPQFYMSLNGFGNKTKYEGYPIPLFKKPEIK